MARLPRVVLPDVPHHVTQRGGRRQPVFFVEQDYADYLALIASAAKKANTRVLAYCLMPNHVHFIMVPTQADGLRATLAEAHRRYTRAINVRENWRGHLWQERFHSFPMDTGHTLNAIRYVELNPVRAGIVSDPAAWPWSSAPQHLGRVKNPTLDTSSAHELIGDWAAYLAEVLPARDVAVLDKHLRTGRPLGSEAFIDQAEQALGCRLRKRRPGPKSGSDEKCMNHTDL